MNDAIPERKYSQRPNLCMIDTVILIDSCRNLVLIFKIDRFVWTCAKFSEIEHVYSYSWLMVFTPQCDAFYKTL